MISGVYTLQELKVVVQADPQRWRPLVLTNGCFDLLHAGHVRYLTAAKKLGRSLVVGLNSDTSVQQIKPATPGTSRRPIVPEAQRAEVLAALKAVDGIVIFSEPTAAALVRALRPDIYVKGGDYCLDQLPEAVIVQGYGGQVELIKVEIPSSTTHIINQILQNQT